MNVYTKIGFSVQMWDVWPGRFFSGRIEPLGYYVAALFYDKKAIDKTLITFPRFFNLDNHYR
jgi:hypothetical protein